jgi:hypothetical protein
MLNPLDVAGGADQVYWCAKTGLEFAEAAYERVSRFYSNVFKTVMWERWVKGARVYYGLSGQDDPFDVSRIGVAGDSGQLASVRINQIGSIMRRAVSLIIQTIPEFQPIAAAGPGDYDTIAQVDFTKNVLNYQMDVKHAGRILITGAECAGVYGEAAIEAQWDVWAGDNLKQPDPENPAKTKTGDIVYRVYTPIDMICDRNRLDNEHDWVILRRYTNRYNLAARYPTMSEEILSHREDEKLQDIPTNRMESDRKGQASWKSEQIPVFTFYHRKCEAMPLGKIAFFLDGDTVLYEGDLPYDRVPLVFIRPGEILRSSYGDTPLHHALAIQDIYDMLASSVATNNAALAVHLLWMPDDSDWSHTELAEGLIVLSGHASPNAQIKPEVLDFNAPNDVALKFMDVMLQGMETIMGVPAALRGSPPPNVASGSFGALIVQQALEYASAFQYSFHQAVGQLGDLVVALLKAFADKNYLIEVVGESQAYELQSFDKDKLSSIHRVAVKSGNPAARTPQANYAAAESLLAKNLITNPKDYLTLMRTGEIETIIRDDETQQLRIRRENELLRQGIGPLVLITDPHREEIITHLAVLDDPNMRLNSKVVQITLAHVSAHLNHLRTADPDLLAIVGQTPLARPGDMGVPPGAPPPAGGPPGMPAPTPPPPANPPPETQMHGSVGGQPPQMPKLPEQPQPKGPPPGGPGKPPPPNGA